MYLRDFFTGSDFSLDNAYTLKYKVIMKGTLERKGIP
jgi:hypothetical protein